MEGKPELVKRSLSEWLALLEVGHSCEIELGLGRIARVAKALKLSRPATKTITVAGTNGKGSAVAIMEALLLYKDRRVGAYTSPHLLHYNERIRINGQAVSDEALCKAFVKIEMARGDVSLSYFEFGTLAALLLFEQAHLDVALLEVGLGGRLDAVNIVDGDVALITSIALDHESWLGDNREQIALEKAGIARTNKPLICTDTDLPATLLPYLKDLGAQPYVLGSNEFYFQSEGQRLTLHCVDFNAIQLRYRNLPLPHVPLPSALGAVQAVLALGETVSEQALQIVFRDTHLVGRWQQIRFRNKNIILDVAHNPAAAQLLAHNLATQDSGVIHGLFSVMADKDIAGIISPLSHRVSHWHIAALPDTLRAAEPADIVDIVQNCVPSNTEINTYVDINSAMLALVILMQPEDVLIGFGSFITVANILAFIQAEGENDE